MRLLVISNMYPSANDPVYGTFVRTFFEEMSRRNCMGVNKLVAIRGKRKGVVAKLGAYWVFYARSLWSLLFGRYDLIYVHTITFPIIPIRIAAIFRKLPLVFNVHGGDVIVSSALKKVLKRLARPMLRIAKGIVVPSQYFHGVMESEFPEVPADRLIVSPSGGIPGRFYGFSDGQPGDSFSECPIVGYVSRIDRGKGWDVYLKSIAELKKRGVACRGVMAGRGEQAESMLALRHRLGLDTEVDYLGAVSYEDLPAVYRRMDVFVFPTIRRGESLGLVGLEAMASGVPVVASRIGGPAEYVKDNVNGFLFEPGDFNDLSDMLQRIIGMGENERTVLRNNAYATALHYGSDSVNDRLYEKLLKLSCE